MAISIEEKAEIYRKQGLDPEVYLPGYKEFVASGKEPNQSTISRPGQSDYNGWDAAVDFSTNAVNQVGLGAPAWLLDKLGAEETAANIRQSRDNVYDVNTALGLGSDILPSIVPGVAIERGVAGAANKALGAAKPGWRAKARRAGTLATAGAIEGGSSSYFNTENIDEAKFSAAVGAGIGSAVSLFGMGASKANSAWKKFFGNTETDLPPEKLKSVLFDLSESISVKSGGKISPEEVVDFMQSDKNIVDFLVEKGVSTRASEDIMNTISSLQIRVAGRSNTLIDGSQQEFNQGIRSAMDTQERGVREAYDDVATRLDIDLRQAGEAIGEGMEEINPSLMKNTIAKYRGDSRYAISINNDFADNAYAYMMANDSSFIRSLGYRITDKPQIAISDDGGIYALKKIKGKVVKSKAKLTKKDKPEDFVAVKDGENTVYYKASDVEDLEERIPVGVVENTVKALSDPLKEGINRIQPLQQYSNDAAQALREIRDTELAVNNGELADNIAKYTKGRASRKYIDNLSNMILEPGAREPSDFTSLWSSVQNKTTGETILSVDERIDLAEAALNRVLTNRNNLNKLIDDKVSQNLTTSIKSLFADVAGQGTNAGRVNEIIERAENYIKVQKLAENSIDMAAMPDTQRSFLSQFIAGTTSRWYLGPVTAAKASAMFTVIDNLGRSAKTVKIPSSLATMSDSQKQQVMQSLMRAPPEQLEQIIGALERGDGNGLASIILTMAGTETGNAYQGQPEDTREFADPKTDKSFMETFVPQGLTPVQSGQPQSTVPSGLQVVPQGLRPVQ